MVTFQGSRADFSMNGPTQPGRYYPCIEDQPKMTVFVLSCFIGKYETKGPIVQKTYTATLWVTMLQCVIWLAKTANKF